MTDDECESPSSLYEAPDVDFEILGVMWLPPDPEDVEDEMEEILFEDDDDERETFPLNSSIKVPLQSSNRTLKEEFLPPTSDHQGISVSLSSRCVWKGTFCERPHSLSIKYYSTFDKPLGRFLREQLFDQSKVCHSCEMPIEAHVYGYTHQHGTLTITVKKLPVSSLPGERKEEIWMWHRCLRCPRSNGYPPSTRRVLMSDAEWGLSFGRFLELSFSKHATASRVENCGHSLHRDCLRCYGFGQMVALFRYESIAVHSVCLPPAKLDFNYKKQEWIEKEINVVVGRGECLFSEVLNALRHLAERKCCPSVTKSVIEVPESGHQITDLERLLQKEKLIFEESVQKILKRKKRIGQPLIDILELNGLLRELVFQSYVWDQRLRYAASLDSSNKPNKVEVRVLNKLEMEDDGDVEDTESWLTTPFSIYYRSSNKNCSWPNLKLDVLSGYNPVYVSSFQDPKLQGGARLLLPTGVDNIVIPVYDDELSSLISYALVSHEYLGQLSDEPYRQKDNADSLSLSSIHSLDTKALNATVSFMDDGKVKYTVTCYYAKHFEALRSIYCPTEVDFVRSLSRCTKGGGRGGDSSALVTKTWDNRFIIKLVTKTELESFMKFAPEYFKYISESIGTETSTCLAKILGIYQLSSKHLKGGKKMTMNVLVSENLLFGRNIKLLYDLKGSSRSRYNPDSSGRNKVLLDQNLIEAMPTSPIFVGNEAKRLLERAVWNDTSLLASIDVMDYSLLVGVDKEKQELVVGIINFMRQYTWDKRLESWVKASGILGGPRNVPPTVISPREYKERFRKAMATYFLTISDQ